MNTDPRQFVRNSNVDIQRTNVVQPFVPRVQQEIIPQTNTTSTFSELRVGKFKPGIYNALVNEQFSKDETRIDIKNILKQKPKGHAPIAGGLTVDISEIKGIYGRFQTGVVHTKDFGLKGDLDKNFFSAQFSGYMMNGIEKKNFSFNIYKNGKIRFSGGFLGFKNLKKQPESLRNYIVDTYTQKNKFLYNDIEYNNIAGQFLTNTNFQLYKMTSEYRQLRTWGISFLMYEPESSPFLYLKYKEHTFIFSTKTGKAGSGIVQVQGESNPDDLESAYSIGVELVKKLHENGYTIGLVNKNVNADKKIIVSKKTQGSTCPKPRRPPCKNGFESRKNPQGYDCCFKIPKKKPVKRKTTPKVKNTKITYDKDGIMKIGGKKCKGLSKKVLLEVSKKLGVVGIKNKQKKDDICKVLDKIEKGNSNYKIDDKLCRELKKDQLVSLAISKGITVEDTDTVKILCQKLQDKPGTPNSPNSLANEMEKVLKNKEIKEKRLPINRRRKLNEASIKNDLIKLYGKLWMKKYGNVMNINKNVREVKNKLTKLENNKKFVTRDGVLKKMVANEVKKDMVKDWKLDKKQVFKKILIEKEANKIYGKFGKNVVKNVVRHVMSLPKTPSLKSNQVISYIQMIRELRSEEPLPLNMKRPSPPRPKQQKPVPKPKPKPKPKPNQKQKQKQFNVLSKDHQLRK